MSIRGLGLGVSGTVPGFGVPRLLRLARTAVLAVLFSAGLLAMGSSASADECPNEALRQEQGSKLSDCRAYELVSPPVKHGGDVAADSARTRASATGDAVSFTSLRGFGDVVGTGIATEYMSVRSAVAAPGTNGWATHAITPPQSPMSFFAAAQAFDPLWEGEFSDDLSTGVFRAWSPVTDDANVADAENLYVRDDLRHGGAGAYRLVSACPGCAAPLAPPTSGNQLPKLAGASDDFRSLLFESRYPLTSDAPVGNAPKLYKWDDGTVSLAGILPDGTPAPRAIAGRGAGATFPAIYTTRTLSADGSKVIFTVGANNNSRSGDLYVRDDHGTADPSDDETALVNVSERTDCADQQPCTGAPAPDPAGPQPATYQAASADGTRIFFVTNQRLTDDDANDESDVYMYDASASTGSRLTRLSQDGNPADPDGPSEGVVGSSRDGHYVYFIAHGQLVAGAPTLDSEAGIYLWRDGSVRFVGKVPSQESSTDIPGTWNLNPLESRVTPDGKHLLFVSHSGDGLTGYDQTACIAGGCTELYVYNSESDTIQCASCNPSGAPATMNADINARFATSAADTTWHLNHALSDDGQFVFFSTAEALVPQDTNGKIDAYEYDTQNGKVSLLSSGTNTSDSYFVDASRSGRDVFFLTRQQLVGWDTDNNVDLYDARVGGGFPEPASSLPACAGEACQGPLSTAPPVGLPASSILQGLGNVSTHTPGKPKAKPKRKPKHCPRGSARKRVHGKVRCVGATHRTHKPVRRDQQRRTK